jgi:hypothetical protein
MGTLPLYYMGFPKRLSKLRAEQYQERLTLDQQMIWGKKKVKLSL